MLKKAFSLAETLICLVIVGILIAFTAVATSPTDRTTRIAYANAYEGLSTAFYNSMINVSGPDSNPFEPDDDNEEGLTNYANRLCNGLTEYINTTVNNCNSVASISVANDKKLTFNDDNAFFISNNGYRFFISPRMETNGYRFGDSEDETTTQFYIVYVDINGNRAPNRVAVEGEDGRSDIFAFALLETGMTVPLGLPEYDTRYLLTRVAVYDNNSEILYREPSVPYYVAKNMAWGSYTFETTGDDDTDDEEVRNLRNVFHNPEVPFTMNRIIRESIDEKSAIRINDMPGLPDNSSLINEPNVMQCAKYDYDNCFVVIDKYSL